MQDPYSNKSSDSKGEIDLQEILNVLLHGRWIIVSLTAFFSTIAVIYSLLLPNIYESKALIAPVNPSSAIGGALKSYSSLAGLAGINFPSGSAEGNSAKAIQKIQTLSFFEENIFSKIYLPDLMALKAWDSETNTVVFNENLFDINTNSWIRDYSYPKHQIPSAQESFLVFTKQHIRVSEDKNSGFITLSIKHQSPFLAKQWVELIVDEINNFYRKKDKAESEKAVIYLNQQISGTSLSEIKEVLANLLQDEIKKLALIEANKFYVFDYIDTPAVMEKKSEPKRALICFLGTLLGGMLGIFLVFIRHYVFKKKSLLNS